MVKKPIIYATLLIFLSFFVLLQNITAEYFQPYYIPGTLYKHPGGTTVYYVANGETILHPFFNEDVFKSWGYTFNLVITNQYLFDYFTIGSDVEFRDGSLVKSPNSSTIYFVSLGKLRPIYSWWTLQKFGWQNRKIYVVSDVELNKYSQGTMITENSPRPAGDIVNYFNNYYYIYDNTKAQITDQWWGTYRYDKSQAASFYYGENLYYSRANLDLSYKAKAADPLVPKGILAKNIMPNIDCNETSYKMAFILLYQASPNNNEQVRVLNLKNSFDENFAYATEYFASMDTSYQLVMMPDNGNYYTYNSNGSKTMNFKEVLKEFYKNNADSFDFVTIFTNFTYNGLYYHFQPVQNNIIGTEFIEKDLGYVYYNNLDYGSIGELKGVILLGNNGVTSLLPNVSTEDANNRELTNKLLEQIGHAWIAYVDFYDYQTASFSDKLRNPSLNDGIINHWSPMTIFDSPDRTSAYDLSDWNSRGVIVKEFPVGIKRFSDLDLYLMGLQPFSTINYINYIDPPITNAPTTYRISVTIKTVYSDQLQRAIGRRECLL